MKTGVQSRTHEEAAAAVCKEAELKQSQKRTALLQSRISAGDLSHLLQAQLSALTAADLREAKHTFCTKVGSSKPVAYLYTHRKLLGRICAIFSLGTAALVGISTIRNTPQVSVTEVPTQTEITQAAKAEGAVVSKPIPGPEIPTAEIPTAEIPTAPLIGPFGFSLGSAEQSIPTPPSIKAKEALAAPTPESMPSPALAAVAEAPQPSPEPTAAQKEFVEIAVELKIQDGRVAEAQVGNRQPGAEAFEATALHIARQRRYPPGTSRTETLVLRVANQFGRKEP